MARRTREAVDVLLGELEITLRGEYTPAADPTPPSYASGGEPGHESWFEVDEAEVGGCDAEELWWALKDSTRDILIDEAIRKIEDAL